MTRRQDADSANARQGAVDKVSIDLEVKLLIAQGLGRVNFTGLPAWIKRCH